MLPDQANCHHSTGRDFIDAEILFDGRPLYTVASPRLAEECGLSVGDLNGHLVAVVGTGEARQFASSRRRARDEEKERIVRFSADQLATTGRRGASGTDWGKVDTMTETELEATIAADPDDPHGMHD